LPTGTCSRSTTSASRPTCFAEDFVYETVKAHLKECGMAMKQGTIIDATLIAAPSSTRNKVGEREREMHQTKKGNRWDYGMKAHNLYAKANGYGVHKDSGLNHSVDTTAANVQDLTPAADLLHGEEDVVYAVAARLCEAVAGY
jgi:IS5 family transposase